MSRRLRRAVGLGLAIGGLLALNACQAGRAETYDISPNVPFSINEYGRIPQSRAMAGGVKLPNGEYLIPVSQTEFYIDSDLSTIGDERRVRIYPGDSYTLQDGIDIKIEYTDKSPIDPSADLIKVKVTVLSRDRLFLLRSRRLSR